MLKDRCCKGCGLCDACTSENQSLSIRVTIREIILSALLMAHYVAIAQSTLAHHIWDFFVISAKTDMLFLFQENRKEKKR